MTLDEWKSNGNSLIELGRELGFSNPKQIYRYLANKRTGKPKRIPGPETIARIAVLTEMKVAPGDWYATHLQEALLQAARRGAWTGGRNAAAGRGRHTARSVGARQ